MPGVSLPQFLTNYNPITLLLNKLFTSTFLSDVSTYLHSLLFSKATPSLNNFLFVAGTVGITFNLAKLLYSKYRLWEWVPRHLANRKLVNQKYFKDRYGHNVYAVVTGPTEGIGFAFALAFARMDIGVVLVARN